MLRRTMVALFAAVAMTLGWSVASVAEPQDRQFAIHVFGDSLTDDGNFFAITGQPPAPYFEGRFSDGPVWVEYLHRMFPKADLNNMAVGGSFTDDRNLNGPFGGVENQIDDFVASGEIVDEDDLVVIWAGANNYLDGDVNPATVVTDIAGAVAKLVDMADARRFLLVNLPPLGDTPAGAASGNGAGLNLLASLHNDALAQAAADLRDILGVQIVLLDVRDLFDRVLANAFGLQNTADPCLSPIGVCDKPNKYLFWDGVHPTTTVHAKIAVFAKGALSAANGNGNAN